MQHQIHDFLSSRICTLFSQYRGMCDMLIEEALPEFFQEVELWLSDSKKACSEIELCSGAKKGLREVLGGLTERGFERAMEKGDVSLDSKQKHTILRKMWHVKNAVWLSTNSRSNISRISRSSKKCVNSSPKMSAGSFSKPTTAPISSKF